MVPTPETAPAARPEGDWFAVAMVAQDMRSRGLAEQIAGDELLKLANRQCSAARASGLLERVAAEMSGDDDPSIDARAAIREVAAWLDLEGYVRAANNLRKEVAE